MAQYHYTPYIWPMAASAVFLSGLAAYAWRRRCTPGAVSFTFGAAIMALWAIGSACEVAALDEPTKLFWFKFQSTFGLPAATCAACFTIEYSGLVAWLTRRRLALLVASPLAITPAYFVDDARMVWVGVWLDGAVHRELTALGAALNVYGIALLLLATAIVIQLFVRSPLHRRPAALILTGHLGPLVTYPSELLGVIPTSPLDLVVLGSTFTFVMYAVALYRFHLFDVLPVARSIVVERLGDAVVVLDALNRIADLNLAAQDMLRSPRRQVLGLDYLEALKPFPGLAELASESADRVVEIPLGVPPEHWVRISRSQLKDRRGFKLGSLIVLHDITDLKHSHERDLQHERALAAVHERELLARELHDSIGQVFAYVCLQADAARKLLDDGKTDLATAQLARLAGVARDAHADVRESIMALCAMPAEETNFFASLGRYLEGFTQNYGISATLLPLEGSDESAFDPETRTQLFRIIQEALSNARKHGRPRSIQVAFERLGNMATVLIRDDGSGFESRAETAGGFGLRFMRERAAEIGGSVDVQSAPGQGTRILVILPCKEKEL